MFIMPLNGVLVSVFSTCNDIHDQNVFMGHQIALTVFHMSCMSKESTNCIIGSIYVNAPVGMMTNTTPYIRFGM